MRKEINDNKPMLSHKDEFIFGEKYYPREKDGFIDIVDVSEPPRHSEKNFYDPCNPSGYYEEW